MNMADAELTGKIQDECESFGCYITEVFGNGRICRLTGYTKPDPYTKTIITGKGKTFEEAINDLRTNSKR